MKNSEQKEYKNMATDIQLHKQQAQELSNKLWAIANDLRGTMDASKFKDYILGIIFYRFLSEKTEKYMEEKCWTPEETRRWKLK